MMLHHDFRNTGRSMKVLLFSVLLAHLGYLILVLPIYLKVNKALGVGEIGLVLAISSFSFQAASLIGGVLADRIGRRTIIAFAKRILETHGNNIPASLK